MLFEEGLCQRARQMLRSRCRAIKLDDGGINDEVTWHEPSWAEVVIKNCNDRVATYVYNRESDQLADLPGIEAAFRFIHRCKIPGRLDLE